MSKITMLVEILFYLVFVAFAVAGFKCHQFVWEAFGAFGVICMLGITRKS